MNEELQSTNEELETINDELRERTGELNQVNDFLETILTSLGFGVAVLDAQQRVQVWNRRAEDLWGLRADEAVDNHFLSLDIGLPSEQLAPALRAVLGGTSERESRDLEAVNRRGRTIICVADGAPARRRRAGRRHARAGRDRADGEPDPGDGDLADGATITRRRRAARSDGPRTRAARGRDAAERAVRAADAAAAAQEGSARRQHEREERVHEAAAERHVEAADLQDLHARHEHEAAEREAARGIDEPGG